VGSHQKRGSPITRNAQTLLKMKMRLIPNWMCLEEYRIVSKKRV